MLKQHRLRSAELGRPGAAADRHPQRPRARRRRLGLARSPPRRPVGAPARPHEARAARARRRRARRTRRRARSPRACASGSAAPASRSRPCSTRSRRSATAAPQRAARIRAMTRDFALAGAPVARVDGSIIAPVRAPRCVVDHRRFRMPSSRAERPVGSAASLLPPAPAAAQEARSRAAAQPGRARRRRARRRHLRRARRRRCSFADGVAERRGLDAGWVRSALAQARFIPSVTRYIMPPAGGTAKNWAAYRARFVEPIRIRAGVAFWRANERWLAQAEEIYGVPPGDRRRHRRRRVDLRPADGRLSRHRRAGDAGLRFPAPAASDRSAFFRDELESWFVLCKQRRHRSARLARQLRRRARHGAVHAVELQQVRGRLRRRRPRRPARAAAPT